MRLVCPSCEAKYEVPDDAIPDTGRDVQCANCGHAWFQTRSRAVSATTPMPMTAEPAATAISETPPAPPPIAAVPEAKAAKPAADSRKAEKPEPKAAAAVETAPKPAAEPAPEAEPLAETPTETSEETPADPPARAVDEKVLSILREEAEREAKARRESGSALESQPDLGIDAAANTRKKPAAKKREVEPEPEAAAKPAARRDLLPDVEEINSTLRPSEEPEPEFVTGLPEAEAREGRGAFRAGFLLVIAFAILGASIYITSGWLSAKVPALAGPLAGYVDLIDGLRLSLDRLMQSATRLITGEAG